MNQLLPTCNNNLVDEFSPIFKRYVETTTKKLKIQQNSEKEKWLRRSSDFNELLHSARKHPRRISRKIDKITQPTVAACEPVELREKSPDIGENPEISAICIKQEDSAHNELLNAEDTHISQSLGTSYTEDVLKSLLTSEDFLPQCQIPTGAPIFAKNCQIFDEISSFPSQNSGVFSQRLENLDVSSLTESDAHFLDVSTNFFEKSPEKPHGTCESEKQLNFDALVSLKKDDNISSPCTANLYDSCDKTIRPIRNGLAERFKRLANQQRADLSYWRHELATSAMKSSIDHEKGVLRVTIVDSVKKFGLFLFLCEKSSLHDEETAEISHEKCHVIVIVDQEKLCTKDEEKFAKNCIIEIGSDLLIAPPFNVLVRRNLPHPVYVVSKCLLNP